MASDQNLYSLRNEYIKELPDRLVEIEIRWQKLLHMHWKRANWVDLHRLILNMVGSGESFGLRGLSDLARRLAKELSLIIGCDARPDSEQEQQVNTLMDTLRKTIDRKSQMAYITQQETVTRRLLRELTRRKQAEKSLKRLQTKVNELQEKITTATQVLHQGEFCKGTELPGSEGEHYTIKRTLGRGGMGITYEAIRNSDQQNVVIKSLLPIHMSNTKVNMRFLQEARTIISFDHPHLVKGYDFCQDKNLFYMVMEFIQGISVTRMIKKDGMSPLLATQIVLDIARGLSYLEKRHLMHRDIKPENIIVSEDKKATLVDFGLVKMTDRNCSLTTVGIVMGTPHYISPEQLSEGEVDIRSDIYSLGATYYHMVVGTEPFPGQNQMQVLQLRLVSSVNPHKKRPNLPNPIAKIIKKMMHRHIRKRPQNTEELITSLENIIANL